MVNKFRASAPSNNRVALPLRNLPTADANADLAYQKGVEAGSISGESIPNSIRMKATDVSPLNDKTLVQSANIGCKVGSDCKNDQHIYLNGMLDVLVAGEPPALC